MSLTRETVTKVAGGYKPGDMKLVAYDITFTAQQVVEPSQDPGYYLMNGCALSQTTYPILFARFGTTFNTQNGLADPGAGLFRLPDLTDGRHPIPKGLTNFTTFGGVGGEINHTLSLGEMGAHAHGDTFSVSAAGGHSHSSGGGSTDTAGGVGHNGTGVTTANSYGTTAGGATFTGGTSTTSDGGNSSHSHGVSVSYGSSGSGLSKSGTVSANGSGGSHNNMQPYQVVGGWVVKYG